MPVDPQVHGHIDVDLHAHLGRRGRGRVITYGNRDAGGVAGVQRLGKTSLVRHNVVDVTAAVEVAGVVETEQLVLARQGGRLPAFVEHLPAEGIVGVGAGAWKQVEQAHAVGAVSEGVGRGGPPRLDAVQVAAPVGGPPRHAGRADAWVDGDAAGFGQGNDLVGRHGERDIAAAEGDEIDEPFLEPRLDVGSHVARVLDGEGDAGGEQDGPAPLLADALQHAAHVAHKGRNQGHALGLDRPALHGFREMYGVPQPVEVDAVHVVVARHLSDQFEGALAHVLAIEVDARPPAALASRGVLFPVLAFSEQGVGVILLPLRPERRRERVVDVVHAERPDRFDVMAVGERDGQLQGVRALVDQRGHVVVREGAVAAEEDLADFRVVGEVVERLRRAVEQRVGLRVQHVFEPYADETLGRRRVRVPHVVAVVVENDASPAACTLAALVPPGRSEKQARHCGRPGVAQEGPPRYSMRVHSSHSFLLQPQPPFKSVAVAPRPIKRDPLHRPDRGRPRHAAQASGIIDLVAPETPKYARYGPQA